jgi:hypothetical protein
MGIETNTTGQNKALPSAFQFNWSQMESESERMCVHVPAKLTTPFTLISLIARSSDSSFTEWHSPLFFLSEAALQGKRGK